MAEFALAISVETQVETDGLACLAAIAVLAAVVDRPPQDGSVEVSD